MSIYRHKRSPYWQFDFEIDGHRFSGSTRLTDKREAEAFEATEKAAARQLAAQLAERAGAPLTFKAAAERWWAEHGESLNDPDIKARLDWLVVQIGPRTAMHAISDAMVSNLVQLRKSHRRRSGRDGDGKQLYRPITARTVNKTVVSLLRRVMRRARDNWDAVIPREPVWKKHLLKETRLPVRELSPAEDAALDAIERDDYAKIRRFGVITGLRRRNLLLTWPQVDFDAGVVRVITKGGVPRTLPLTQEAYAILWSRRGHHPQFVFTYVAQRTTRIPKGGIHDNIRVKGRRYPVTYTGLGSNKRNWAKAGVNARIHDWRHTTGMRTLRATGNLKLVQKLLGHTDIAITAKFYTDATLDDLRAGMEAASVNDAFAANAGRKTSK